MQALLTLRKCVHANEFLMLNLTNMSDKLKKRKNPTENAFSLTQKDGQEIFPQSYL